VRPGGASAGPRDIAGLDPAWSRQLSVVDAVGVRHTWHVLDNGVHHPVGTLLCVHGNPTWSYLWRGLLASAPPGWRVVAPDQLGMGYSQRPASGRRLRQRVSDLAGLTEALGVDGPVVTVGHDWGGPISLGWGLAHAQQLLGVVLANTAVVLPAEDRGPALIRLARLPFLREALCVRTPVFVRAASALSRPALPSDVRRALARPYAGAARRQAVGDFVADIPFGAAHPSRPALEAIAAGAGSIDVPALLLWGPRDPVFGEQHLRDLRRRLPQAQLHRYEGASHLVTEDAPQYAEAVARWVADLTAADRKPASPSGAAPPASAPERRALWSALAARADDPGQAVVEVGGRGLSWADLYRRVGQLAAGLWAAGVRPGDRVAMLLPPSPELTAVVYALWRMGAVVVVADRGLGFAGVRRALRSAAVDHVIGTPTGLAAARLMRLPGRRIAAGANSAISRRVLGVEHHLDDLARLGRGTALPGEPSPEQDCAVVFTSGATGPAKGVVYRHRQVLAQLELLASTYGLTPADRLVAAFAPFALLGPALGIGSAVPDIDVTAPATLTAATLAEAAIAVEGTVVFASPAALRSVSASAAGLSVEQRAALGRVRLLISAGAPVPATLLHSMSAVLPMAQAHTPYGMTEVLPVTDVSLEEIDSAGAGEGVCVGRPLPGVDVAVSPLSTSGVADAPLTTTPETTGEVCVRAAHVMDRYDALWWTQRNSSRDPGWHRTGDVGHLDRHDRLWIEGRLSHVVTTAAGALTPVAVEQRVEALDTAAAAAAVGVGPPGAQVVVVVVVPAGRSSSGAGGAAPSLASAALTDSVRKVAGVEVAAVLVRRQLPMDIRHAAKVDRRELAEWAAGVLSGRPRRRRRPTRR
jgi:cis-3-alkyl-4-acyloxetan-2-one decarboxylase / olefin beta-lactone synthetase